MPEEKPEQTARPSGSNDEATPERTGQDGTSSQTGRDADGDKGPSREDLVAIVNANKAKMQLLQEQLAEANERAARGSQPAADASADSGQDELELLDRLRRLAPHDPAAAASLIGLERERQMRQDVADAFTLSRLPEADQQPMLEYYERYRAHFRDLADAVRYVRGRRAEVRAAELEKELEAARGKAESKTQREEKPVRTSGRDVNQKTMTAETITREDFDDQQARLKAEGRYEEARAQQRALRDGKLLLKG